MEHKLKELPKSELEITITLSEEEMQEYRGKAAEFISKDLKIKGFRPGHVPLHVLEQHIGKKHIEMEAQEIAIQKSYTKLVIAENIQVVARPKIKINGDNPFSYTATVAVLPKVEMGDYKSIKVKKTEPKTTEKDVEEVIEDLKKRFTSYKETENKSKKGDRIEVNFDGFDDKGKELAGTASKNHPVIIGSETMIPGFEDELIGLKKGEKKEFNITFPKDYHHKDFQGKKVTFKVEVQKVEEAHIPELSEELIEKISGKKISAEEFRKEVHENIQSRKEQEAKNEQENTFVEELLKKAKIELPEALIEEEKYHILREMKDDIGSRGMDFAKFLEQAKTTEDELLKKYEPEAEKRLKVRLCLQHLIKAEDCLADDQEIAAELEHVKSFYPKEQRAKIQEDFDKGELKNQILNRLSLRKLFTKLLQ